MTNQQINALVNLIKNMLKIDWTESEKVIVMNSIMEISDQLLKENPNFDTKSFFKSCGINA